ncbi:ERAD-associated E3 ubiquitin-protein ligase doa10 [Cercospora zeina]
MDDFAGSNADPPDNAPNITNHPAFEPAPPRRRDTVSSIKTTTDGGQAGETCRICRSEAAPNEPLFYPCKCSGSIKFVHQECLMEWLSHSHKKHCELCKTPFRFTKLYDAAMPKTLPWSVFVKRACIHVVTMIVSGMRAILVISVWLLVLPLLIRSAWRWIFWFADAGWAREDFIRRMQAANGASQAPAQGSELFNDVSAAIQNAAYDAYDLWFGTLQWGAPADSANAAATTASDAAHQTTASNIHNATFHHSQADVSILSSWTYLSELTSSTKVNRLILDVFEGQLITCVVILGFILVFLIREWVVQQQPLVNLEQINHEQREHDQLVQRRDRLRRQAQLLEEARARLAALQNENGNERDANSPDMSWEQLYAMVDAATSEFGEDDDSRARFAIKAAEVLRHVLAAENAGSDAGVLADKVYEKLRTLSDDEREAWEEVLLAELEARGARRQDSSALAEAHSSRSAEQNDGGDSFDVNDVSTVPGGSASQRRPPMPTRATSSAATHIKRILEESSGDHLTVAGPSTSPNTSLPQSSESASLVSAPSLIDGSPMEGNWISCSPPSRGPSTNDVATAASPAVSEPRDYTPTNAVQTDKDVVPITNAGPDAKVNIKRKDKGKARLVVPEPADGTKTSKIITADDLKKRIAEKLNQIEERASSSGSSSKANTGEAERNDEQPTSNSNDNPFHPDGPEPESSAPVGRPIPESEGNLPTTSIDDAEEEAQIRRAELGPEVVGEAEPATATQPSQPQAHAAVPQTTVQWVMDWFWGDIQPQNAPEPVPTAGEERINADDPQEAPFVPVQDGIPVPGQNNEAEAGHEQHDPEVIQAAQQAGLDAEAIEDAEDLEGILELIGLQGPLIGLFQTSCFCCVLVIGSVAFTIAMPYMWGKLVLLIIQSPFETLIKSPLRFVSMCTDFLVDLALLLVGWLAVGSAIMVQSIFSFVEMLVPRLGDSELTSWVYKVSKATAISAYHRLVGAFPSGNDYAAGGGMQWAWLQVSVEAHAALRTIQREVDGVLKFVGNAITTVVETVSPGSVTLVLQSMWAAVNRALVVTAQVCTRGDTAKEHLLAVWTTLFPGSNSDSTTPFDPSLVYWNYSDRGLAVLAGYVALAMLAAIYVAVDTPITSSPQHQKIEKMVRDSLRQAGGVVKVILIISIEMLVFPLYCGLLLDVAFLPLQDGASLITRWAYANEAPYTFCFIHWFIGTCYMFHFALFVGMCRKILRKGVLWFIRDPDDPTFHPVRDVLERSVTTQLRKIAFSALVYGALVILCLGGVIWGIGRLFPGIFPIYWLKTEPYVEFALDLFLFMSFTPKVWSFAQPSKVLHSLYSWWLRRCARALRLSHFLFDERKKDEEGRHIRRTWSSFLTMKTARVDETFMIVLVDGNEQTPDVTFERNGKYVLTPCSDQYRPPKPGEAFIHVENDDVYIADKDGKQNEHFGKIYIPPNFRARMTVFMVSLWVFSAFIGLCSTLLPLSFGRQVLALILPEGVVLNDLYAYTLGAYSLGGLLYLVLRGKKGAQYVRAKASGVDFKAWIDAFRKVTGQALRCVYVYGFVFVVLPLVFAMLLQLYFVLPLHTYLHSAVQSEAQPAKPTVTEYSIHILADSALGVLVARVFLRSILTAPTSPAAEAVRRITTNGYLNPSARLATRFVILPGTLLALALLLIPVNIAGLFCALVEYLGPRMVSDFAGISEDIAVAVSRYSYPVAAAWGATLWGADQIAKATERWRARIRDEVYLVGERLHNFGEKKPPPMGGMVMGKRV